MLLGMAGVVGYWTVGGREPAANDPRWKATEVYFAQCSAIIDEANKRAESTSWQSSKIDIMKKAFAQAEQVEPPREADSGAVVRMKTVLKEGRECYEAANGEWSIVRNVGLGLVTGVLDGLGGSGIATGTLLTGIGAEIALDDAEARELAEAAKELERYLADKQ